MVNPQGSEPPVDRTWAKKIRLQARQMRKTPATENDPDQRPNTILNERIMAAWRLESPKFWARLMSVSPSFPEDLATVLQAEMRVMYDSLIESGMSYTDAREIAERETLMMEPESELSESPIL